MDGATFEIWIPKREEEQKVSYYRPGERPSASATINQRWAKKKKHFGINHHFERLEGRDGLLENTSIRRREKASYQWSGA